jgi:putative ABC transport system permease protein
MTLVSLILAFVIVELALPYFRTLTGRDVSFHIFTYPTTWATVLGGVLVVGLLSGLYPAILLSRFKPVNVLKSFAGMGSRRFQIRHMLILVQFTISIALITSTLIVVKQLRYTATKNLGFDRHQVVVVPLNNRSIRSQSSVLKEKLLAHPAILSASAISNIPGEEFPQMNIEFEGMSGEEGTVVAVLSVDYDYLDVLKAEMVQGRSFSRDIATDEKTAFIVNQTIVEKLGWDDPIGKKLSLPWYERKGSVIGVIHDFHNRTLHYAIEPVAIVMEPVHYSKLLVRIDSRDIQGALTAMNAAWEELSPLYPFEYSFLDSDLNNMYRSESNTAKLLILFSALAIFIACLGLFGLATFIAEQRTKEVGIRKTLGASVPSIVVLLTRDLTLWVIISNIIACPIAYYTMSRWLNGFVFRTNIGWSIFILAAILTLIIAIATISIQAFKAALTNPVNTLRYE